ncbi:MAG: hypothetical protein ACXIVE_16045 [Salinarimonas sp.]
MRHQNRQARSRKTGTAFLMRFSGISLAAVLLAACTPAGPPRIDLQPTRIAQESRQTAEAEPVRLEIPDNRCGLAIRRFADLLARDLEAGMVAQTVHDAAMEDLVVANNACRAGAQDQAISALRATRIRHGYPAG